MKVLLAIFALTALQTNCRHPIISLTHNNGQKIIALQPLDCYDTARLSAVSKEISAFFNTRVMILAPVKVPKTFYSANTDSPGNDGYFADSLLQFLSEFINDTIIKIVGITRTNIYTLNEQDIQLDKKKSVFYEPHTIFGLSYISGNTSIVSDYRLQSVDNHLFENRLKKVIIHELGHNLGLSHCSVDTCLMSETNGDIVKLNKTGGDYCKKCRRKLN
jgi:archaemetzincin